MPVNTQDLAYMLRLVFTEAEIKTFADRATTQKITEPGDHQHFVLVQFIAAAEEALKPAPTQTAPGVRVDNGPSLETLRRKYFGPDGK